MPPLADAVAEAVLFPLQLMLSVIRILPKSSVGSVMFTDFISLQPLLSLIVTECLPAASEVAVVVVCELLQE